MTKVPPNAAIAPKYSSSEVRIQEPHGNSVFDYCIAHVHPRRKGDYTYITINTRATKVLLQTR